MTLRPLFPILALCGCALLAGCSPRAVGEHSGTVARVARAAPSLGALCKVDLVDIAPASGGAPSQVRVDDPEMFELLRRAMETRQPVKVAHQASFFNLCFEPDGALPVAQRVEMGPVPSDAPIVAAPTSEAHAAARSTADPERQGRDATGRTIVPLLSALDAKPARPTLALGKIEPLLKTSPPAPPRPAAPKPAMKPPKPTPAPSRAPAPAPPRAAASTPSSSSSSSSSSAPAPASASASAPSSAPAPASTPASVPAAPAPPAPAPPPPPAPA